MDTTNLPIIQLTMFSKEISSVYWEYNNVHTTACQQGLTGEFNAAAALGTVEGRLVLKGWVNMAAP